MFFPFALPYFDFKLSIFVGTCRLQIPSPSSEGPEGVARHAAQKEAADGKKKKRAEKAWRRHQKEKEIFRRVRAGKIGAM